MKVMYVMFRSDHSLSSKVIFIHTYTGDNGGKAGDQKFSAIW